jgi:ribose 5-phosphate isomerase RpiB
VQITAASNSKKNSKVSWLIWAMKLTDLGNDHLDPADDYVDFARKVADEVVKES